MSKIALLIGTNGGHRPGAALVDARRRAARNAADWGLPLSERTHPDVVSAFPMPIESARQYIAQARATGVSHLVLFGTAVREAFETALLARLQPNMPRTIRGLTFLAVDQLATRGADGSRSKGPLCFAQVLEDRLPVAA